VVPERADEAGRATGERARGGTGPRRRAAPATSRRRPVERPTRSTDDRRHRTTLFLTYWKLDEGVSTPKTNEIARSLTEAEALPPEGAETIRWDGTPDGWGIVLRDSDDYAAVDAGIDVWRAAAGETAFFEKPMTAPAAPAEEIIRQQAAMLERTE
jgi:hypothetical protein